MTKETEIRSALEGVTKETLADALALFLAEGNAPSTSALGMTKPEFSNFAEAVQYLKKEYGFAELNLFTTEADLVYVQAGERRVLLTDRINNKQVETKKEEKDPLSEDAGGRFSHLELG
jgi:hypothetical protein